MIYEIRMTVTFEYSTGRAKLKTTLIEYINANGVDEAFVKAAERKHEILVEIAKAESELWSRKAWGPHSNDI